MGYKYISEGSVAWLGLKRPKSAKLPHFCSLSLVSRGLSRFPPSQFTIGVVGGRWVFGVGLQVTPEVVGPDRRPTSFVGGQQNLEKSDRSQTAPYEALGLRIWVVGGQRVSAVDLQASSEVAGPARSFVGGQRDLAKSERGRIALRRAFFLAMRHRAFVRLSHVASPQARRYSAPRHALRLGARLCAPLTTLIQGTTHFYIPYTW